MRAHQSRLDVIGNNIANVNTYGFKGSRATFRDVYYQTSKGAGEATAVRGGTNPTQIGYGAQLGSVDVMQTRSSFAMTDNGMDVAIAGEGFFQVQDTDGNTFYTRAGMLSIDSAGNLVDLNGNFVLGVSGNPLGQEPSDSKIQVSIPSVDPAAAKVTEDINGAEVTINASNSVDASNVSINIISDPDLPLGQKAVVNKDEFTTSGITVRLNANETFGSMQDVNDAINAAITEANGGKPHPGGDFTINIEPADKFPADGLTGAEVASKDFTPKLGSIDFKLPADGTGDVYKGFGVETVGSAFAGTGESKLKVKHNPATTTPTITTASMTITMDVGGVIYTGTIPANANNSGKVLLQGPGGAGDTITMKHPGYNAIFANGGGTTDPPVDPPNLDVLVPVGTDAKATEVSKAIGLGSKPFKLTGGTEGGPQTVNSLSGVAIGQNGVIEGIHPILGRLQLGRIDVVTFDNPQALEQAGNTYFRATSNSGATNYAEPGSSGSGALAAGSLEMSNVDLSKEFSDMIVTQRGFQANSRIITVSDEILNELVNLKR